MAIFICFTLLLTLVMIVKHPQDLCHPHPQAQNRRRLPEWLLTSCHGFVLGLQELVTVRGHRWAPGPMQLNWLVVCWGVVTQLWDNHRITLGIAMDSGLIWT